MQSAFVAWQQGAGTEGQTLGQYLAALGLRDSPQSVPTERKRNRAIREAEAIKAADTKREARSGKSV